MASRAPESPSADETWSSPTGPSPDNSTGSRIGPFRILSILGEGGMGIVYLAEQTEPVKRRVALKVIRTSFPTSVARARFAAERQAMARLSHTNVAQIFEAGTTYEGWPYFVMEHIRGDSLDRYCDANRLSVNERLRLFMDVCKGVRHAHQRGIMHRDLKPNNVLVAEVDGRPVPKIIDFGIAKALDDSLTGQGPLTGSTVLGSPSYMSPESLLTDGDVDMRTDVYSLGVMLYELLAGERPFQQLEANLVHLLMTVTRQDAPSPSCRLQQQDDEERTTIAGRRGTKPAALVRRLSGDLDCIVQMAIARDPEERYSSVAALAAELERFLRDEPVEARPTTWQYQLRKFVQRNRLGVAAGTAVLATLLLGVFGTSVGMVRANMEADRATQEAERANRETAAATEVADFLTELFAISTPSAARSNGITARELLDDGAEEIEGELSDQPLVQAQMKQIIGSAYGELGLYERAEEQYRGALETRRRVLGDDHPDVATSANNLAVVLSRTGQNEEAEALFREALSIARIHLDDDHPHTIAFATNLAHD